MVLAFREEREGSAAQNRSPRGDRVLSSEPITAGSICVPHWERHRVSVPALREIAGMPMCRACINGRGIGPERKTEVRARVRSLFTADPETASTRSMARSAMNTFSRSSSGDPEQENPLTTREEEILRLLASGYRNNKIAEKLLISRATVYRLLPRIFAKVGVSDRIELALFAIHRRLIDT